MLFQTCFWIQTYKYVCMCMWERMIMSELVHLELLWQVGLRYVIFCVTWTTLHDFMPIGDYRLKNESLLGDRNTNRKVTPQTWWLAICYHTVAPLSGRWRRNLKKVLRKWGKLNQHCAVRGRFNSGLRLIKTFDVCLDFTYLNQRCFVDKDWRNMSSFIHTLSHNEMVSTRAADPNSKLDINDLSRMCQEVLYVVQSRGKGRTRRPTGMKVLSLEFLMSAF